MFVGFPKDRLHLSLQTDDATRVQLFSIDFYTYLLGFGGKAC